MGNFLLSLQDYLLQMKKLKRKSLIAESSFSFPLTSSNLCPTFLFKKLLKDTRWLKETGNRCIGEKWHRGRTSDMCRFCFYHPLLCALQPTSSPWVVP